MLPLVMSSVFLFSVLFSFAIVGRYLSKHRLRIEHPRLFKLQVLFPFVFNLFNVIPFESSGRAGIIADDAFRFSLI